MITATAPVTNAARMQAVCAACTTAFDQAYTAWTRKEDELRRLRISIQCACSDELQDCVAAAKAGVP